MAVRKNGVLSPLSPPHTTLHRDGDHHKTRDQQNTVNEIICARENAPTPCYSCQSTRPTQKAAEEPESGSATHLLASVKLLAETIISPPHAQVPPAFRR
jgi:hypothetical protein